MRRYIFVILFFVVLVTPFILRAMFTSKQDRRVETEDNATPLIIISSHPETTRREFQNAFERWHLKKYGKPVSIEWRNYGGSSSIVRFFDSSRPLYKTLGTYKIDLVWGGGDYLFDAQLKAGGHLQGVDLGEEFMREVFPQKTLAGLPLYDVHSSPPQWFGTALASFGICYNRDALRYLGLPDPKTWKDLTDPRYRGWIVLADPTLSASARMAFMIVVERAMADAAAQGRSEDEGWARGMGTLRQIAANTRLFTDSSEELAGIVATGDVGAAMIIDFFARSTIERVGEDRMGYVEPENATAINPDPIAMVKGAEHREVAIHFIKFVLSEQGQKLWIVKAGAPGGPEHNSLRRMPVRKSVYEHPEHFTDKVDPFRSASEFNTSNARKKTFNFMGELIQMSMMDPFNDLRETRAQILASPRAAELDAKLGMFPFGQAEALRRYQMWKDAKPIEKLALERKWTNEFRDEYRRLREEAMR